MRHALLIACLLALACVPAEPVQAQVSISHQIVVLVVNELDQPVAGVLLRWRNEWHQAVTDAAGACRLEIAPQVGIEDTLLLTGATPVAVAVRGGQNTTVRMQAGYVRITCGASAPYRIEGLTITVGDAPVPTATATVPKTGTIAPILSTPTPTATPSLWGDPLPADVRCAVEGALLEAVQQQACLRPPLDPVELAASELYITAHAYSPGVAGSNWLVSPGIPLTGEVVIETPIGQAQAMAFADVYVVRIGPRIWVCQWGSCVFAGVRPGMSTEVVE